MISHESRLINDLLARTESAGHRLSRPVQNVRQTVLVQYGISLIQILDIDEINQNIVINIWEPQVSAKSAFIH